MYLNLVNIMSEICKQPLKINTICTGVSDVKLWTFQKKGSVKIEQVQTRREKKAQMLIIL